MESCESARNAMSASARRVRHHTGRGPEPVSWRAAHTWQTPRESNRRGDEFGLRHALLVVCGRNSFKKLLFNRSKPSVAVASVS